MLRLTHPPMPNPRRVIVKPRQSFVHYPADGYPINWRKVAGRLIIGFHSDSSEALQERVEWIIFGVLEQLYFEIACL